MTEELNRCHDCGCLEGQIHQYGCDVETCPFCLGQLISCDCSFSHFYWKYNRGDSPEIKRIHDKGMNDEEEVEWFALCVGKGRIPYVVIPILCVLCGRLYPYMFNESDDQWDKYVIPELQDKVLCFDCWNQQRWMFPTGWRTV